MHSTRDDSKDDGREQDTDEECLVEVSAGLEQVAVPNRES